MFAGIDSEKQIKATREAYLQRRKTLAPDTVADIDDVSQATTQRILPQYAQDNVIAAKHLMTEGKKVGVLDGVVLDASQAPAKRHRAGPCMPALQKSSLLCTIEDPLGADSIDDHIFTCGELSWAHGWPSPSIESCPDRYKGLCNYDLSSASLNHQAALLGDGMSLNAVEAWLIYIFAHTVRREAVMCMVPSTTTGVYDQNLQPQIDASLLRDEDKQLFSFQEYGAKLAKDLIRAEALAADDAQSIGDDSHQVLLAQGAIDAEADAGDGSSVSHNIFQYDALEADAENKQVVALVAVDEEDGV
jgi:hypothetical protein